MSLSPFPFVKQNIDTLCQAVKRHLHRWTKPDGHGLVYNTALDLTHNNPEPVLENILLRQQLTVLTRPVKRPALSWRDRSLFGLLASTVRTWKQALAIVQPATVLRWQRDLFRWLWRRQSRSWRLGRPPLADEVVALIKQMAQENRT